MIFLRKKTNNPDYHKGFTLVEILVTLVIFILVVVGMFNLFSLSQRFYVKGEMRAELLQNGRVILERMAREIRQANEIVTSLPQVEDNPDDPPVQEIEFQDGHTPSPYQSLGSDYYYIRYYFNTSTGEIYRQYRVYCFDDCSLCSDYFRWNDTLMENGSIIHTHPCLLEEKIIGEYLESLEYWGTDAVNVSLILAKGKEEINLKTEIFGRNF